MAEEFHRLLREHRTRRRWSQESLALEAEVSARHVSYLETGKARPSREMVLRLARVLDLALRDRNSLLVSAGFAAVYPTTPLGGAALEPVDRAVDRLLAQQEPYGAVLIDRSWNLLRANAGARRLFATFLAGGESAVGITSNLVRAMLHPDGLRPYIVNWAELVAVLHERIERELLARPSDEAQRSLLAELRSYPEVHPFASVSPTTSAPVAVLHLRRGDLELRLVTLLTTIGTPIDVTVQELTIESFFPADRDTERWFRADRGGHS